jgi:pimeloyl-ACP methyl ester carboxylesterase
MKRIKLVLLLILFIPFSGFKDQSSNPGILSYNDVKGFIKPVTSVKEWGIKRTQILEGMQLAMGKIPDRSHLPELDVRIVDTLKETNYIRLTISFYAAIDERVPAYLYLPVIKGNNKKLPAMLVLHGTGDKGKQLVDGESPNPNRAHAKELAERGYVVIAPDYPGMGDLKDYNFDTDRYESGTMKAIINHMRCVDLLQSRKEVDPKRIGVIGHSLGGHNSLFVGAFDTRLKVIVSSCGWTLMDYYDTGEAAFKRYGGKLGPWSQDLYMPLIRDKYNLDPAKIPFDFDEVIAALAPRAFFSNSPVNDLNFNLEGVRKGIASALEVYRLLNAAENIQVRYPDSGHDFPTEVRLEAYQFIDKILNHTPAKQVIK